MEVTLTVMDDNGTILDSPEFISMNVDNSTISIKATEEDQIGRYMVSLKATLDDVRASSAQINFILNVLNRDGDALIPAEILEPDFSVFVHTQRLPVGSNMT